MANQMSSNPTTDRDPLGLRDPLPWGEGDNRVAMLRAAVWRAIVEIENDGIDAAYETLLHAYNQSLEWKFGA